MPHILNKKWKLRSRPQSMVSEENFELAEEPIPHIENNQILVRNRYIAFEPAMRGWLDDIPSYVPPVQIGEVMRASAVGQVIESKCDRYKTGDMVAGQFGWQEYALAVDTENGTQNLTKVPGGVSPHLMLSVLGTTGLTAYFGMLKVGIPSTGNTVLVSGAAGATGSIAGQIARLHGASKVVGIAGGTEKCALLQSVFGFDAAINYKSENVRRRLREEFPSGIDIFYDNVGGPILDHALLNMARNGRIVICGGISSYNEEKVPPGPKYYMQLVARHLTMEGFLLFDYADEIETARKQLMDWVTTGKITHREDIKEGIENAPKTFLRLFEGKNLGKQLLKLRHDDP